MAPEMIKLMQMSSADIRKSVKNVFEYGQKAAIYSLGLVIFDAYLISVMGLQED